MSNRDTAWQLLDRCVELYTPEARQDHDDFVTKIGGGVYIENENGVHERLKISKEEKAVLLEELRAKHPELISAITEVFVFLTDNFPIGELTEDEITELAAEAKGLLHGDLERETASDKCFPIVIINDAMRNRKIPIIDAPNWKEFAKQYTKIIMAA